MKMCSPHLFYEQDIFYYEETWFFFIELYRQFVDQFSVSWVDAFALLYEKNTINTHPPFFYLHGRFCPGR